MTHSVLSKIVIAGIGALLLSATVAGSASAGAKSAKLRTLNKSDYISQEDIRNSRGGYKLRVKGIGDVRVLEVRAPEPGKKCRIEKRSLRERLRLALPDATGPTWLRLNYISVPDELGGGFICIGEGVGCYILVSRG